MAGSPIKDEYRGLQTPEVKPRRAPRGDDDRRNFNRSISPVPMPEFGLDMDVDAAPTTPPNAPWRFSTTSTPASAHKDSLAESEYVAINSPTMRPQECEKNVTEHGNLANRLGEISLHAQSPSIGLKALSPSKVRRQIRQMVNVTGDDAHKTIKEAENTFNVMMGKQNEIENLQRQYSCQMNRDQKQKVNQALNDAKTSTTLSGIAVQRATSLQSDPVGRKPHQRVITHRLSFPKTPMRSLPLGARNEKPPPSAALGGESRYLERAASIDRWENQIALGKRKRDLVSPLTPVLDEQEAVALMPVLDEQEAVALTPVLDEQEAVALTPVLIKRLSEEEEEEEEAVEEEAVEEEALEEENYNDLEERFKAAAAAAPAKAVEKEDYDDDNSEVENVVERCIHLSEEIKSLTRGIFEKIAPGFLELGGL